MSDTTELVSLGGYAVAVIVLVLVIAREVCAIWRERGRENGSR